jgi:predicted P-loop ATPase
MLPRLLLLVLFLAAVAVSAPVSNRDMVWSAAVAKRAEALSRYAVFWNAKMI